MDQLFAQAEICRHCRTALAVGLSSTQALLWSIIADK